jgi:ABC-type nickel/cobalt efflux system permease component RcnA
MLFAAISGLIAGLIHVLSGPDHLAAIAPLAVRRPKAAWVPGMRWGIGHSAGVTVIGLASLWLRDRIPIQMISSWGERLVGVMLLAIGFWALRKALKVHAHEHEHDGDRHVHLHSHTHTHPVAHHQPEAHHGHTHAAFGIGILHGLAGSSHFLGVLPILAFPTHAQALTYLLTFGIGTVAAMAGFSGLMGWITRSFVVDSARIYRRMMTACALSAMAVGCFWLFT